MAMSHETRRRMVLFVVALIVVAMVLASTGCSTTTGNGEAGQNGENPAPLESSFYPAAMGDVCAATDGRISDLPERGVAISESDWATEISRALDAEADAFDAVEPSSGLRVDHKSFIANTREQAASWAALSDAIANEDATGIDTSFNEIRELSGGRNELAAELSIDGCQGRALGS